MRKVWHTRAIQYRMPKSGCALGEVNIFWQNIRLELICKWGEKENWFEFQCFVFQQGNHYVLVVNVKGRGLPFLNQWMNFANTDRTSLTFTCVGRKILFFKQRWERFGSTRGWASRIFTISKWPILHAINKALCMLPNTQKISETQQSRRIKRKTTPSPPA